MPIYDPKTRLEMKAQGLNPDEYEEFQESAPVTAPTPNVVQVKGPTALGAGARSFARNIIPTMAGIGGSVAGTALGSMAGPITGVAGGIGGGIGASILAKQAQDAIIGASPYGEQYAQSEATDYTEQPLAATVGGIASALPALGPGIRAIPGAARALRDIVTKPIMGQAPHAADLSNLANVGLGATIPTAIRAVSEPDVTVPELLAEAVGGAVLNKPTKLGQKMGLSPNVYRKDFLKSEPLDTSALQENQRQYEAEYEAQPFVQEIRAKERVTAMKEQAIKDAQIAKERDRIAQEQLDRELATERQDLKREEDISYKELEAERQKQKAETFIRAKTETLKQEPPVAKLESNIPQPKAVTETGKEIYPDYTGNQEIDALINEKTPLTEAEQIQEDFDTGRRKQVAPEEQTQPVKTYPNLAEARNVKVEAAEMPYAGSTDVRSTPEDFGQKTVKVNPLKAGPDTELHEVNHQVFNDLEQKGTSFDKKFTADARKKVEADPEFQKWHAGLDETSPYKDRKLAQEEWLVKKSGLLSSERAENRGVVSETTEYAKDFWSNVKRRMGKDKFEDYSRILSRRTLTDRPFNESFRPETVKVKGTINENEEQNRNQDVSSAKTPEGENTKEAPVTYRGAMEGVDGKKLHLYDLNEDIDGHPKGSTVSEPTLIKKGYKIPAGMEGSSTRKQETSDLRYKPEQTTDDFGLRSRAWTNTKEAQTVKNATEHLNRIKNLYSDEYEILKEAGIEEWAKGKKVSGKEIDAWIAENGPKVEVKELSAADTKSSGARAARMAGHRHLFDTMGVDVAVYGDGTFEVTRGANERWTSLSDLPEPWRDKVKEFVELTIESRNVDTGNDSATARYTMVNPKPLKDMEGAVDLLVRIPHKDTMKMSNEELMKLTPRDRVKYSSSHYPKEGKNLLAHVRGNMETLPNGKKVFHVFEAQSDWAQEVRDATQRTEQLGSQSMFDAERKTQSDPLLKQYERLAMKAAINHARKNGADYIALSDAETAMITEGHDRNAVRELPDDPMDLAAHENAEVINIPQEKGMRLHYDQTLPKILSDLTGSKGERVDFGEHQNVKESEAQTNLYDDEGNIVGQRKSTLRSDLIFKNPDGTPKTTITARLYPIDAAKATIEKQGGMSMIGRRFQETSETGPTIRQPRELKWLMKFRPALDKVRDNFPEMADRFDDFGEKITEFRGQFINKPIRAIRTLTKFSPTDYLKNTNQDLNNLWRYLTDLSLKKTPTVKPKPELLKLHNDLMRQIGEERNKREGLHQGELRDNYIPGIVDRNVLRTLNEKPNSAEAKKLIKDFFEYHKTVNGIQDETKIQEMFDTFKSGFAKKNVNIAEQFGPLDKAEGLGLPESWREKNYIDVLSRYSERVARRLAYYDAIESKNILPEIEKNLGNSDVAFIHNEISSVESQPELFRNAVSGVIRAGMMGTLTGAKDFASNIALGFQHHQNPVQVVKSALSAWSNMKQNIVESFEMGRNRVNINSLEMGDGSPTDVIAGLRRLRDVLADVQGRNWLEQMTRATAFGQGKFLVMDFMQQYKNGELSKAGKKFFDDFGKGIDIKKGLTENDIKKMAARYVDSVQGTYDFRGLPQIALEGSLSPYLALARWSIEKANNYNKHVVTPLINGNPQPFLMATLGMFIGGAAVNELVEQLTGKKNKVATIGELTTAAKEGKNIAPDVMYKAVGLAAASGYAGAISDLVKSSYDYIYGKNKPQLYNNVLIEAADNNLTTIANLTSSALEDGITPDLIMAGVSQILEDNLQAARILMAHIDKDRTERANKLRDLRVFNTLSGNKVVDLRTQYTDKLNDLETKKFKRAETIEEAAEILPGLLKDAIEEAEGSPEKLKAELRKLKQNSYQTMPNPKTMPDSFVKYILFLEKSQGPEVAQERLKDYIMRNAVNRAKSSMVP